MQFEKFQLVRRKEAYKDEWWSHHPDTDYIVMHDTEDAYENIFIYPVGGNIDDFLSVYAHTMELVDWTK